MCVCRTHGQLCRYDQWCNARNGGGYTQAGVAKGLKVPCLFMITKVSIRCQKTRRLVYAVYPRIPPNTPLDMTKLTMSPSGRETDVGQSNHVLDEGSRSPWEGTLLRGNRCWPTVKYLKMSGVLAFDRWVHLSLLGMMRHV